jgi:hypothetical protein
MVAKHSVNGLIPSRHIWEYRSIWSLQTLVGEEERNKSWMKGKHSFVILYLLLCFFSLPLSTHTQCSTGDPWYLWVYGSKIIGLRKTWECSECTELSTLKLFKLICTICAVGLNIITAWSTVTKLLLHSLILLIKGVLFHAFYLESWGCLIHFSHKLHNFC